MHITEILKAWAKGKSIDAPANGFPSQSSIANLMSTTRSSSSYSLPDDRHELVDRVISRLIDSRKEHYRVICLAYLRGWGDSKIAKEWGCSRSTVRARREAAEHYLDALIGEHDD